MVSSKDSHYEHSEGVAQVEVNSVDSSSLMTMASKSEPVANMPLWAELMSPGVPCSLKC
jgi:hypothetical protein